VQISLHLCLDSVVHPSIITNPCRNFNRCFLTPRHIHFSVMTYLLLSNRKAHGMGHSLALTVVADTLNSNMGTRFDLSGLQRHGVAGDRKFIRATCDVTGLKAGDLHHKQISVQVFCTARSFEQKERKSVT
jgi:hypothetical protein